jgi:hypothetical protein
VKFLLLLGWLILKVEYDIALVTNLQHTRKECGIGFLFFFVDLA